MPRHYITRNRNRKPDKKKLDPIINLEPIILEALKNTKYDYRTAKGIATQLKVPLVAVENVLSSDSRVRTSVIKSRGGTRLYALKERTSAFSDYISAFRALSSDKMNSYDAY